VGGLSWGAGLALELYRRHPQVPRSLVLASAYAGWAGSLPPEVVAERLRRVMREAELPPAQWVRGYLPGLFTDAAPAELVEEALAIMLEVRPGGMRPMRHGGPRPLQRRGRRLSPLGAALNSRATAGR
jgi:pimeloyl-ACP methyl ester carboxylesterase